MQALIGTTLLREDCCSFRSRYGQQRAGGVHVKPSKFLRLRIVVARGTRLARRLKSRGCESPWEPDTNLRWSAALSLLLSALAMQPAWAGDVLRGPARIVDGDTLEIAGERVRLLGVDAPEKGQICQDAEGQGYQCGLAIKEALTRQVGSSPLECTAEARDMYGRNVSKCTAPGTGDLGTWLISKGYAVAYRQYSKEYIALEESAHAEQRGIWRGSFQVPAEWRREHKRGNAVGQSPNSKSSSFTSEQQQLLASLKSELRQLKELKEEKPPMKNPSGCAIKGNISAYGKIYHVPGSNAYDSVRIDTASGERWFCSREDAEQAGWRPAKSTPREQ